MELIGYARVSTTNQDLTTQIETLTQKGCQKIFREKVSGADGKRPELEKALSALQDGDTFVVTRLDRLARSTKDLLNIIDRIEKSKAKFLSLADPWADTTIPTGRLLLTVFGGLAEFEQSLIKDRTDEGRARARREGRSLGRPFKLSRYQRDQVAKMKDEGKSNAEIAALLNVSRSTISRSKSDK